MLGQLLGVHRHGVGYIGGIPTTLGQQLRSSLVHIWEMDVIASTDATHVGILDSAPGTGIPLVVGVGAPSPTQVVGLMANAMNFNGSANYLIAADDPTLRLGTAFTVICWVYPTAFGAGVVPIISKGSTDLDGEWWMGMLGPNIYIGLNTTDGFLVEAGGATLNLNSWNMMAFGFDRSASEARQFTTFINGVFLYHANLSSSIPVGSSAPLRIGWDGLAPSALFAGSIDDTAIFSSMLSANQLLSLWNSGSGRRYPWDAGGAKTGLIAPVGEYYIRTQDGSGVLLN